MHPFQLPWSSGARALFQPAAAFRAMLRAERPRPSIAGQSLLAVFVLGCTVSLAASGRLSVRLIVDGSLSFAFLPVFAVAGFAVLYHAARAPRPVTFAPALGLFATGQAPWLLWLILLATVTAMVRPRELGPWLVPLELSLAVPAVWSGIIDFQFFRQVLARPPRAAIRDVMLYRLLAWGASTAYFLGIAIWHDVVPQAIKWLSP